MTVFFVRVCVKLFKNILYRFFLLRFLLRFFLALLMLGNNKFDCNQSSGTSGIDLTELLEMAKVCSANPKTTFFFAY